MLVTGGDTNVSVYFQMRLTAGGDATALTITDFDLSYTRNGAATAAKVDVTDLGSASAAHTDNGGYEVDPTDCPGLHRFDFPDAAFAAGVRDVLLTIKHTNTFTETLRVEIDGEVSVTEWNGVKLGTTNPLPTAAADAAGGLPISAAGGNDLDAMNTAAVRLTAARAQVLDDWINAGRLDLILDIIAADTTTDIPALIATAQADLDIITGASGVVLDAAGLATDAVNEIRDAILASVLTEPAQAIPPTTGVATLEDCIRYVYFALTNRVDSDAVANFLEFYNRAEDAVHWKKAISDAANVASEATGEAGP